MAEASAATAETAPEAPAKSSNAKKLIVIIVVALIVLGGGGGAAYYFMGSSQADDEEQSVDQDAEDSDHTANAKAKGKKGKKGREAKKSKKPVAPAIYYKMDPALVVNFEAAGVTRFLQVAIEISTRDPVTAEELKLHDPVIRNDLLLLFGSQQQETIVSREGKDKLRTQALQAVRNVIDNEGGEGSNVENVYFTSFVMQ